LRGPSGSGKSTLLNLLAGFHSKSRKFMTGRYECRGTAKNKVDFAKKYREC